MMNRVLVIGATGHIGRQVVSQLLVKNTPVRILTRRPEKISWPSQVEVVPGDLAFPESLDGLREIDTVFLVWAAPPDTAVPVLERIAKQARRIVFLSSPHKTAHPMFQKPQPNPVTKLHRQIEHLIETSGLEWTFLRPGLFAVNALHWWGPQIRTGDAIIRWPHPAASSAPVDERDIAAVAVRALCEDGHAGAEYVLTGSQPITQEEQVSAIGRAIGHPLRMEEISPEQARKELFSLWPATVANMLLESWAGAIGQPTFITSTVEEITGTPARTFLDWVAEHAAEFRD